jgi:hypothetical protein
MRCVSFGRNVIKQKRSGGFIKTMKNAIWDTDQNAMLIFQDMVKDHNLKPIKAVSCSGLSIFSTI